MSRMLESVKVDRRSVRFAPGQEPDNSWIDREFATLMVFEFDVDGKDLAGMLGKQQRVLRAALEGMKPKEAIRALRSRSGLRVVSEALRQARKLIQAELVDVAQDIGWDGVKVEGVSLAGDDSFWEAKINPKAESVRFTVEVDVLGRWIGDTSEDLVENYHSPSGKFHSGYEGARLYSRNGQRFRIVAREGRHWKVPVRGRLRSQMSKAERRKLEMRDARRKGLGKETKLPEGYNDAADELDATANPVEREDFYAQFIESVTGRQANLPGYMLSGLDEEKPVWLRRCVASVAKRYGGDVSKAFAICTAKGQDSGLLKPGTNEPTAKGTSRAKSMGHEPGHKGKLAAYEKMLKGKKRKKNEGRNAVSHRYEMGSRGYSRSLKIGAFGLLEDPEGLLAVWNDESGKHRGLIVDSFVHPRLSMSFVRVEMAGGVKVDLPAHAVRVEILENGVDSDRARVVQEAEPFSLSGAQERSFVALKAAEKKKAADQIADLIRRRFKGIGIVSVEVRKSDRVSYFKDVAAHGHKVGILLNGNWVASVSPMWDDEHFKWWIGYEQTGTSKERSVGRRFSASKAFKLIPKDFFDSIESLALRWRREDFAGDAERRAVDRFIAETLRQHDYRTEGNVTSGEAVQSIMETYGSTGSKFGSQVESEKWIGAFPEKCDLCGIKLKTQKFWVDGRTRMGPWANMCPRCFEQYGVGLGTGVGQKYDAKTGKKIGG